MSEKTITPITEDALVQIGFVPDKDNDDSPETTNIWRRTNSDNRDLVLAEWRGDWYVKELTHLQLKDLGSVTELIGYLEVIGELNGPLTRG